MKAESVEEMKEESEQLPSSSNSERADESSANVQNGFSKSDSMPNLQPLLALPAPSGWKAHTESCLDVVDENGHGYVGLQNQCQTCYLNSLVQTLYMAPEFRNIIYNIEPKTNSKGIHHQLQKLFAQLQTSNKGSLQTVDLTESFGWQNEQLYQHDVQELFRVLIEALEKRWEKTPHKGCIEALFKGDIIDYVKCLKCGTIKSKPDIFLDLSLAIKADGELKPYKSLEESLVAFTKPEILDGNNKYKCENCNSLEDAEKGLAIKQLPPIIAIQLKRYSFDYNTLHRVKLNDRLTFPDYLDLNKFLYKEPDPLKPKLSYAQVLSQPSTSSKPEEEETPPTDKNEKEDDSGWFNDNLDAENVQRLLENGPYVYELFSVLIHQGSATGGHYFAYIKNMDQQRWFCFNDSNVSNATLDDVKRTFGGNIHLGFNSSNAYMLMYRRIDPVRNQNFIHTADLPEHVKLLLEQVEKEEQEIAFQRQLEKEKVTIHVICNDRTTISDNPIDFILHKNTSYAELRQELCLHYPTINEADVRLIQCNYNWEMNDEFNKLSSVPPLHEIHRQSSSYYKSEGYIMLDTKQGSHFYEMPPSNVSKTADVHLVDLDAQNVFPAKRVCFDANMTVADLKGHLCVIPEVRISDPLNLRIVFDPYQDKNQPMILWSDNQMEIKKLARLIRGENLQLYVDVGSMERLEADRLLVDNYEKSLMHSILERKKYNQRLVVWLPSSDDFLNANLSVPDSQNISMPPKLSETCEPVEEEGSKELSVDETDSTSSTECIGDKAVVATDYVPPDPFQKCSVAQLNIDSSKGDAACVLSQSSLNSSTGSNPNTPAAFVANETEPLDPEQMEVLIKTSSSASQPELPPPPYSETAPHDRQPAVSNPKNGTEAYRVIAQFNNLNDDDDGVSLTCSETPKRSPTPNVSDDENDSVLPRSDDEFQYKMRTLDKNMEENATYVCLHKNNPSFANNEPEMEIDLFRPEKSVAPSKSFTDFNLEWNRVANFNKIQIVDTVVDSDCTKLELSIDRRQSLQVLHEWLAIYLRVNKRNIQLFKFYHEFGDGFAVNSNLSDTVQTTLSDVDHVSLKLNFVNENNKGIENCSYIKGKDHKNSTPFRRERQLRIKLASESEP